MNAFKSNWFTELSPLWPGQCLSLEIEEVLHHEKSDFQDIMFVKTKTYGRMLILDGVIQLTERDEFAYQEMIAFLPLNSHPDPKRVLVIGGGDGGVIREVVKHPSVESVVQCEIDAKVIELCKKYIPSLASGYNSPKLTQHIGDGFEFMKNHQREFDVIITDSSDPIGPAESLFQKEYFELMKMALRPGGIVCSQGENMWIHLNLIEEVLKSSKQSYPVVDYGYTSVPTYPGGQIGFILCSLNPDTNFREPVRTLGNDEIDALDLQYYSTAMHRAAFILPMFVEKRLAAAKNKYKKSNSN